MLKVVTSAMMEIEVLGGPHDGRTEDAAKQALLAVRSSKIIMVATTPAIASRARELRLAYNVHSMDALTLRAHCSPRRTSS